MLSIKQTVFFTGKKKFGSQKPTSDNLNGPFGYAQGGPHCTNDFRAGLLAILIVKSAW